VAIVALVLWVITAAAGVSLLNTGGAARRRAAEAARAPAAPAASAVAAPAATIPARPAAIPLTADGRPPPVPRPKVTTPPGEHPLLEFSHPALAITGSACWFMYVFVRYTPFAWISFGILMAAIGLGLTWLLRNAQAARRHASTAWRFPPQLAALHGGVAAIAITLSVLTALSASHG
jgi:UPF0716 family protein affecting phage T7 exclusion